jgi:SNF2 family DNA or RNA helicase
MQHSFRPRSAMREQQRFIAEVVKNEPFKMIVSDMGSGKTAATLDAVRHLLDNQEVSRVLIVGPKLVAKETWRTEIRTWEHTRCLSVAVCVGDQKQRAAALAEDAEITCINRETLPWLWEEVNGLGGWKWDMVVIDESSTFKAGESRTKRTRVKDRKSGKMRMRRGGKLTRFGVLAAARSKVKRVIELTGTPGQLIDLWGQIYLLDQGARLGRSKDAFEGRWFKKNPYSHEITPFDHSEAEIMALIDDLMVSMPKLQIVPPPVHTPIYVDLPPAVMKEYREFKKTLVSDIYDVEAVNAGVLTNKLMQFANGSMYNEQGEVIPVHKEKLDALDELIERADGDNVLIFYGFRFDLEEIRKRHPDAIVLNEAENAVSLWNEGKITKLLAHPASCAHGLNLQYGGHIAIWFGLTWSLELWLQANARLPRPGQTKIVSIYQILARGTVDERALSVLADKGTNQDRIIQAVLAEIDKG